MSTPFPVLQTKRLQLRKIEASDQGKIFEGLSHPDVIRYYGVSYDSFEATKEQMDWFAALEKEKNGLWWAICRASDGTFVGAGGFNNWSQEHQKAEIGFWLLPDHWGKGYMSEAMPVIAQHGFDAMGMHRIEGFVDPNNTACKNALKKLNYTLEGTMRDCERKNDHFISINVYSKLAKD